MDWKIWLKNEKTKAYFRVLQNKLRTAYQNHDCLPLAKSAVFRALTLTPLQSVKVVILGQDPYPQPLQANGLAFSVIRPLALPASLQNIFQALKHDFPALKLNHGDLSTWAKQGVLLLNTCLTVAPFRPLSHLEWNWQKFTTNLLTMLNTHAQPIVFLLWGKAAQAFAPLLTNPLHLVLKTSHPSPLSAHRGFLTARHFAQTNQFLVKHNLLPIDWNLT